MNDTNPERPELAPDFWQKSFGDPIKAASATFAAYDALYGKPKPIPKAWHTLALDASTLQTTPHSLSLRDGEHTLTITAIHANCLHVRLVPNDTPAFSYAVLPDVQPSIQLMLATHNDQTLQATFGAYTLTLTLAPANLTIAHNERVVYQEREGIQRADTPHVALTSHLPTQAAVYGTGERTFDLNLRGRALTLWNTDAGSYQRGFEPINYCVPFALWVTPESCVGVFFDNTHRGTIDIGSTHTDALRWQFEGGDVSYYLMLDDAPAAVVAHFTALTGRMPLPPLWTLGHHQARYSYFTQAEVLAIAEQMRDHKLPCDALYLDIHYMDGFRVFTWDKTAFPDLKGLVDALHAQNLHLVVILDPGVKVDPEYPAYQDGIQAGIFMTMPDQKPVEGVVWPGLCHHPDFTNPKARTWWQAQLKPLLETGVDGVWNDMNEPLYFSEDGAMSPPDYVQHAKEGIGGTHAELHNVYGHLMAQASYEALRAHAPQKRPFNFTRSGYAGTQRHASSWTGDNTATWDNMRLAIAMNLNMGLSGQSFTGPDIGGFARDTNGELLARWYQACVLFPYYRNHSAIDTIAQEAWRFGEPYLSVIRRAVETRYRLLPALYTAFAECHFNGTPILRPIFTLERDPAPFVYDIDDSYALGEQILVAPILAPHTLRRSVYLPKGSAWYDFWTHARYEGGQVIRVDAPLDTVPLFVKAGTVLHIAQLVQHLSSYPPIERIVIYAGEGATRIYEDAGDGFDYQHGAYRWITYQTSADGSYTRTIKGNYGQSLDDVPVICVR